MRLAEAKTYREGVCQEHHGEALKYLATKGGAEVDVVGTWISNWDDAYNVENKNIVSFEHENHTMVFEDKFEAIVQEDGYLKTSRGMFNISNKRDWNDRSFAVYMERVMDL